MSPNDYPLGRVLDIDQRKKGYCFKCKSKKFCRKNFQSQNPIFHYHLWDCLQLINIIIGLKLYLINWNKNKKPY